MRDYALEHSNLILEVLESSSDGRQRSIAATLLGYAAQSKRQIAALAHASQDANNEVRNNAVRALGVLARSDPKLAAQIPAEEFIPMLHSGAWTDLNKGSLLLDQLSVARDTKLLSELREQALDALIEMARWRSPGHSYAARMIIGRIAGIEEKRLEEIVEKGEVQAILDALK
jgi:HEAT repeat protein